MTDPNDTARRYAAYFEEWLKRDEEQRGLRPLVMNLLSTATWQVGAMDTIRRNSPEMARELNGEIDRNLQLFATMLPLPVEYNRDYTTIASSTAAVTSNANVFQTLLSLRPADFQPAPSSDIQIQIDGYQKLVEEQERAAEAGRRVARLFPDFPDVAARFIAAKDAVAGARGNPAAEESAAFATRTFLDKFQGELFSKAGKAVENMKWDRMAERLGVAPSVRDALAEQEQVRSGLIAGLSSIGKRRGPSSSLNEVWIRVVDHVYVVCGLVLAATDRAGST